MSLMSVLFVVVAAVVALSALGVVLSRHIVHMAVWLLFTLVGVALLYFLLGAEFLGAAQLIIYVGGTLVLLVFGVMLTAQGPLRELRTSRSEWIVAGVLACVLFVLGIRTIWQIPPPSSEGDTLQSVSVLGLGLLGVHETIPKATLSGVPGEPPLLRTPVGFLLPFEIVSVHLLVVLIGAAYLARARHKPTVLPSSRTEKAPSDAPMVNT
jgi:NADH-quinone oxidoreductase subunit J